MLETLKGLLYFPIAHYFRFFAQIKLARWSPRIIVVTGSSGKTTLLHLIEAQLGERARYSHHANSSYGIPFDILGLERKTLMLYEWIGLFLKAPFLTFSRVPAQKLYIVEADCDRPGEGRFLSALLNPEVTIWLSSSRTHSMNFEHLIKQGKFKDTKDAIAYEYGHFLENTSDLAIVNADYAEIRNELKRTDAKIIQITKEKYLKEYEVSEKGTEFKTDGNVYKFPFILPEISYFSIVAVEKLTAYLGFNLKLNFADFIMPPGRGSIFKGMNDTIIIDSSYNASKNTVLVFLDLVSKFKRSSGRRVVLLLGDMRELGKDAEKEHKEVAKKADDIVDLLYCVGPLTKKFVIPNINDAKTKWFPNSRLMGEFLKDHIEPNSIVLVKGSQNQIFLEESIKYLLADPRDVKKLCRQEEYWIKFKKTFFSEPS